MTGLVVLDIRLKRFPSPIKVTKIELRLLVHVRRAELLAVAERVHQLDRGDTLRAIPPRSPRLQLPRARPVAALHHDGALDVAAVRCLGKGSLVTVVELEVPGQTWLKARSPRALVGFESAVLVQVGQRTKQRTLACLVRSDERDHLAVELHRRLRDESSIALHGERDQPHVRNVHGGE